MSSPRRSLLAASVCAALAAPPGAEAVSLAVDGRGQALIYPYYTVQSSAGNPFNTYLSVVNHTAQAKAVRVRVRESRNARPVGNFNLYLSPNDVWTGAIVPDLFTAGARLITADRSCTLPAMSPTVESAPGVFLVNTFYSGAFDDGAGSGIDRTREGWVEILEMATMTGAAAAGMAHNSFGAPVNCSALQAPAGSDIAPPTGGLSGTLTLINVASGLDFTVKADALESLSTRPFYRPADDPYPDFAALEIDPVSIVVNGGYIYRSTWSRGLDAVSAALMRDAMYGEFVLDAGTASKTDWVMTFPTRHHYVTAQSAAAPFTQPAQWSSDCASMRGESVIYRIFNRAQALAPFNAPLPVRLCASASAFSFGNSTARFDAANVSVLGSVSRGLSTGRLRPDERPFAPFENGWGRFSVAEPAPLASLGTSTRMSTATGASVTGPHTFLGLPVVGFMVRTFENGTLTCGAGACQGNYGGAFPLKFRRTITP